jgi:hypothetical protein
MDERLRFVARLLEGEKMARLCAEFGISRKTGYKIFDRYKDCGLEALTDRSRRPYRQANRVPAPIEATIVRLKRASSSPCRHGLELIRQVAVRYVSGAGSHPRAGSTAASHLPSRPPDWLRSGSQLLGDSMRATQVIDLPAAFAFLDDRQDLYSVVGYRRASLS